METEQRTQPRPLSPKGVKLDPNDLAAKRYGTHEMNQIWGAEKTFEYALRAQAQASLTLSRMYPDIVSLTDAAEISSKANLNDIDPNRIRELEDKTGHDIIAINKSLEEKVSPSAGSQINKARTSADTTETAKALQKKESLIVIAGTIENLRDILLEKSMSWIDKPHMDLTHLYDAMPTVAGRPFAYYAEILQSDLDVLKFFYDFSIRGKWGDATGNHHSAKTLGIDGMKLQEKYCSDLGIGHMIAPAQVVGLEFEADIFYVLARTAETLNTIAKYIAGGRGDDTNIFINGNPKKSKGSSGMPHKGAKNGNPTAEEQVMSMANYMRGVMMTALSDCDMPYARNLSASSSGRITLEDGFKFFDHAARRLAGISYWIELRDVRSAERATRSLGVVTSPQVMTYLTDYRKVDNPMRRSEAHDLIGRLADEAWNNNLPFIDVLLNNSEITSRLNEQTLRDLTNPVDYIGMSKEIIRSVYSAYHGKKTFEKREVERQ
jgi:adenylosuccinate lyase